MAAQSQIDANRLNAQKSTGPRTPEGKARSRRNGLQHGLTAKTCMRVGEDPNGLLDLLAEIREKFDPQDTDEDFLIERMAKARFKYNRIMPPSELARYKTSLLREYDRSRQELEKLQKIRAARRPRPRR